MQQDPPKRSQFPNVMLFVVMPLYFASVPIAVALLLVLPSKFWLPLVFVPLIAITVVSWLRRMRQPFVASDTQYLTTAWGDVRAAWEDREGRVFMIKFLCSFLLAFAFLVLVSNIVRTCLDGGCDAILTLDGAP